MRAINTGNIYRIYDNSMKTYDSLPARAYTVCFDKQTGFYLEGYSDIEIKEKTYGVHESKVTKVLNAFKQFNRNLGVILSGDKGIGKSLFSKMLAKSAIEQGIPLLVVNTYYPGIADYLDSIEQEVMILFDEFDKTFVSKEQGPSPQAEMLTLFDGIAQGKKLFVVTCNNLRGLNDYLVNRPGRFHYHFAFNYPTDAEITEYLQDKLQEQYYKEITKVISFAHKINLNYDCLRAIAFELNNGDTFEEAIKDLNILHIESERYDLTLYFTNGESMKMRNIYLDMFSEDEVSIDFEDSKTYDEIIECAFVPADNIYEFNRGGIIIRGEDLKVKIAEYYKTSEDENDKALYAKYSQMKADYLLIRRQKEKSIHYTV